MEVSRHSLKPPIPEIFHAWNSLSKAADAHLAGDEVTAAHFFRSANLREVWDWVNPNWSQPHLNVTTANPAGDSKTLPPALRDPIRDPNKQVKSAVLRRDGYRCRYCGIPVIHADIRKLAHRHYPSAIQWNWRNPVEQHAAFQCMWLQFDHVVPHSHSGSSSEDNVVVCCALCNYGKDRFTLKQLGLSDPRLRSPEPVIWDGLERLRRLPPIKVPLFKVGSTERHAPKSKLKLAAADLNSYFLPQSWIKNEYLYTPAIEGKERWFKLGKNLTAEPVIRDGLEGHRVLCSPKQFKSRGLDPEKYLDAIENIVHSTH